jgi:hypothetical protein
MRLFRKAAILAHRYLGIGLGLLVIMWFATGITMIYAGGMPRLTPQLRLERLRNVDLSSVRLNPVEAADRAGQEEAPGRATLLTVLDRPAYRFTGRGTTTVFADTGDVLAELSLPESRTVAARFSRVPEDRVHHVRTLTDVDQWTLTQSRQLPLYKFRVDDPAGTELYVQPHIGEVTLTTTRRGRGLAWISTIPHWLYFRALRVNQPAWYRLVVWTSALACAAAVLGLVLGATQFRRTRPFRLSGSIPYAGWMRWHYITGVVFGLFTLTFAFSGLLSMEPFAWTNATGLQVPRDVLTGGPADLSRFTATQPDVWDRILEGRGVKEMEFVRIQDEHYYVIRHAGSPDEAGRSERLHQPYNVAGRAEDNRLLVAADTMSIRHEPFSEASLVARLRTAAPDAPIVDSRLLSSYDSYYYSRGRQTPLPVLRVKFGDPAETWLYVDPAMSQILASVHRLNRVERWLYNGLHSLDFSFWYDKRPLWDAGLGGLATSTLGWCMGIRRVRRSPGGARVRGAQSPAPDPGTGLTTHDAPASPAQGVRI